MNPIRVKLSSTWEIAEPDYEKEFIGKTGTLVWASKTCWGELQVCVELDEPHSKFGNFLRLGYMNALRTRVNTIVATPINADLRDCYCMAELIDDNWNVFRDKDGDSLPWSSVAPLLELREKKLAEQEE